MNTVQIRNLHRALLEAFDARDFDALIEFKLGVRPDRLARPGPQAARVLDVVQAAETAGWTEELVQAAYEARPGHPGLVELYEGLGLAPALNVQRGGEAVPAVPQAAAADARMQAIPAGAEGILDIVQWRDELAALEGRVCRVESHAEPRGTGFLVGPDLVLTTYYMLDAFVEEREPASSVRFRFDYRMEGGAMTEGTVVALHPEEWLVDASPTGTIDKPDPELLDYVLVRLDRPIGAEVRTSAGSGGGSRGWVRIPEHEPALAPGAPLFILQHAMGKALSVTIDTEGMLGVTPDGSRLLYRTETEPGSGGAPCFGKEWELVAMHEGRDPERVLRYGIRISAIARRLAERVGAELLGGAVAESAAAVRAAPRPKPRPIIHPDDPQKGRWGGEPERGGRRASVRVHEVTRTYFVFDVDVEATDGTPLRGPVVFHLHDTYPRSVIHVWKPVRGKMTLRDVSSYGVFAIGVQVMGADGEWLGLEVDLATHPGVPESFRDQ